MKEPGAIRLVGGSGGETRQSREDVTLTTKIWLPSGRDVVPVAVAELVRLEAERDYVRFVTGTRTFLLRGTMSGAMALLCPTAFIRVHRSTIVARSDVARLRHLGNGAWAVICATGPVVPIGRSYLRTVRCELGMPRDPWDTDPVGRLGR